MITCTVDYDRTNNVTAMLTDTTFSGGFARIDTCKNGVEYLVRYNNGTTLTDTIEGCYHVAEALQQAVCEVADALAFDASEKDRTCDYFTAYTMLRETLDSELNLC